MATSPTSKTSSSYNDGDNKSKPFTLLATPVSSKINIIEDRINHLSPPPHLSRTQIPWTSTSKLGLKNHDEGYATGSIDVPSLLNSNAESTPGEISTSSSKKARSLDEEPQTPLFNHYSHLNDYHNLSDLLHSPEGPAEIGEDGSSSAQYLPGETAIVKAAPTSHDLHDYSMKLSPWLPSPTIEEDAAGSPAAQPFNPPSPPETYPGAPILLPYDHLLQVRRPPKFCCLYIRLLHEQCGHIETLSIHEKPCPRADLDHRGWLPDNAAYKEHQPTYHYSHAPSCARLDSRSVIKRDSCDDCTSYATRLAESNAPKKGLWGWGKTVKEAERGMGRNPKALAMAAIIARRAEWKRAEVRRKAGMGRVDTR